MSAPPPGQSNGAPKSNKPNPLRPMRKKPVNPLVARNRKPPPKPASPSNASRPVASHGAKPNYNGWSEPPPPNCNDIPIMMSKKALLDGVRFHLMKFHQTRADERPIDPSDQDEFARPVTLHRRDPRQPPAGRALKEEESSTPREIDQVEAERQAQAKADKEAQRAIDQAKIAPVVKEVVPKKPKKQKEERTQFYRAPRTEAARKEADLRYEEALPWHIEDADGKNVWSGSYEAALSHSSVAFIIDGSAFRMVPLEKWYRFTHKSRFATMSLEQAEAMMNRKVEPGRWIMKDEESKAARKEIEETRRMLYGRGAMVKTESATFKAASRSEKMDHDELDMSGDEFQDDDETPFFERNEDEDIKESKDRVRREQLGANTFGEGDETQIDKALAEELQEELNRQKLGKATKKALIKRDREEIYESDDSDEKPWTSSSEDEDSSDDDEEKKDEDKKKEEGGPEAKEGDKSKGSSSKGNTTPQGKQKAMDLAKSRKSLKRAGSPGLSESSGNESSRKKKLKKTLSTAPGSRSGSPLPPGGARSKMGAGSGSDGEATAGEMSDGAGVRRKKIKIGGTGPKGTPSASRAGSPIPSQRAGSPLSPSAGGPIEPWEILHQVPAEGIAISDLIKPFQGRVGDGPNQMPRSKWITMVRTLCEYGPDKRLRPRKEKAGQ